MAEEWVKDTHNEAKAEAHSRFEIEKMVGNLKENQAKLFEQLKEAIRARDSFDAGLKKAEKQAEEQRKQLHFTEINLETEKQLVKGLREELQKVRETAQLAKEVAEAEKQAAYTLGVEETQVRLTEELFIVCREYYDISWGKAFDAARVPTDSDLRQPENVYYDLEIRKLPGLDSSHPEQAPKASEQSLVDQTPLTPFEAPKEFNQNGGQGKKAEDLQGISKDQDKKKTSFDSKEKAPDAAASQPGQTVDLLASKTKA